MEDKDFYIYGKNSVREAIASDKPVEKIYISYTAKGDVVNKIFISAKKQKIPVTKLDKNKFRDLEKKVCPPDKNSQGLIALMRSIELLDVNELAASCDLRQNPVIVILDGITDPHNFGAIARSVECSGAAGMIITEKNSAPVTPVAMKASAGALGYIRVARAVNLINAIEKLKDSGFWIYGTDDEAEDIYTGDIYDRPIALIIGSEGKGMKPSVKKHCDKLVKIPLMGKVSSLNASVAAGVVLFEALRQKENT